MKRLFIIAFMFWNLLWGHSAQAQSWANHERYAQANRELMASEPDSSRVVLMGNSITEFWEEMHPNFFVANHLVCRGISGQVSSQMLARFRQDVINLSPSAVVINCGTNDIAENNGPYDEDITMDNIMSMTELALSHGIKVMLSSVLPCDSFGWNPSVKNVKGKISRLNERIHQYALSRNLIFIDYHTRMRNADGGMFKDYSEDGVHPNSEGYNAMEATLSIMLEVLRNNY